MQPTGSNVWRLFTLSWFPSFCIDSQTTHYTPTSDSFTLPDAGPHSVTVNTSKLIPHFHPTVSSSTACRNDIRSRCQSIIDSEWCRHPRTVGLNRSLAGCRSSPTVIATHCESVQPLRPTTWPTTASQAVCDGDREVAWVTTGNLR